MQQIHLDGLAILELPSFIVQLALGQKRLIPHATESIVSSGPRPVETRSNAMVRIKETATAVHACAEIR